MQKFIQWLKSIVQWKSNKKSVVPEITADLICESYEVTGLKPDTGSPAVINGKTCAIGVLFNRFKCPVEQNCYVDPYEWMHELIGPEETRDLYSGFDGFHNYREGRKYYNIGQEAAKRLGVN